MTFPSFSLLCVLTWRVNVSGYVPLGYGYLPQIGFSGKQTLRQRLGYRKFIGKCSWNPTVSCPGLGQYYSRKQCLPPRAAGRMSLGGHAIQLFLSTWRFSFQCQFWRVCLFSLRQAILFHQGSANTHCWIFFWNL